MFHSFRAVQQTLSRILFFPALTPDIVNIIRFVGMQENLEHTRTLAPTWVNQLVIFRQELEKCEGLYDPVLQAGRSGSESKATSEFIGSGLVD